MEVRGWKLGGRIEGCMQLLSRKLILYRTGWYGRNFSYWSMNQYWNTFKMYRLRYRPILDNTGRTKVYRSFRLEKRNLTGTKTERKNRRNAWFEQTQCSKLPPHWHRRLDLLLPFFFFFSFSRLLSLSIALISSLFLQNNEHCYVISLFLFGILFEIS